MKLLSLTAAALVASPALAHGPAPEPIPLARLEANLRAETVSHPNDPDAHYRLGRLHYFAFVQNVDVAPTYPRSQPPDLALPVWAGYFQGRVPTEPPFVRAGTRPKPLSRTERIRHLKAAVAELQTARRLRGGRAGLAELTLACVLEDGASQIAAIGPVRSAPLPTERQWRTAAARLYLAAYDGTVKEDLEAGHSMGVNTILSHEAGTSYLRLTPNAPHKSEIRAALTKLEALPQAVTPLIFSLDGTRSLDTLLDRERWVRFDLDGTGRPQRVPWVRPDTAILVWDPENTGNIRSGRQLFGAATWWMAWNDGYAALAALDDDRDGWVSGTELAGLALWFDRNGDGISDPGEVVAIARTPIAGLATRASGRTGLSPMHPNGLRLTDGRTLPTIDWTFVTPRRPGSRGFRSPR